MKLVRVCGVVLGALLLAGCQGGDKGETDSTGLANEASAAASAAPAESSTATPEAVVSSTPMAPDADFTAITMKSGDIDKKLSTTITRVTCIGEPVSGVYLESETGADADPYGDVSLNSQAMNRKIKITHSTIKGEKYRVNIGCGFIGSTNEWRYEFNIVPIEGGRVNDFVCAPNASCELNGKHATLR
jgi:hypothetical protein